MNYLRSVFKSKNSLLTAIPSNVDHEVPTGFIAPRGCDFEARNIQQFMKTIMVEAIVLDEEGRVIILDPRDFRQNYVGPNIKYNK